MITNEQIIDNDFLIEKFLSTKKSDGTKEMYGVELKQLSSWADGIALVSIDNWKMLDYANWLSTKYKNEKTLQRKFSTIRSFYKWLLVMKVIKENPTEGAINAFTPNYNPIEKTIDEEELMALSKAAYPNARNYALIATLATTGMRVSELCNMRWKDIMKNAKGDYFVKVLRKGNKEQLIPLRDDTISALLRHRHGAFDPMDDSPVFTAFYAQANKAFTTEGVRHLIAKIAKEAGLEKAITPHWLRHTYATLCIQNGASLVDTSSDLGHSNTEITMKYAHAQRRGATEYFPVRFDNDEVTSIKKVI